MAFWPLRIHDVTTWSGPARSVNCSHFTLRQNPLRPEHVDDFVCCYRPENRSKREETEQFQAFTYEELVARDKASLDIFWLRDESLEDTDNLPPPEVIAGEIVEDLEAALAESLAVRAREAGQPKDPSGTIASCDPILEDPLQRQQ